jgi:carboxyl-terminal processing protease
VAQTRLLEQFLTQDDSVTSVKLRTFSAFALTLAVFGTGLYAGATTVGASYAAGASPYKSLDTFARALSQIERYYVEPIDSDELVYRALEGMADSLDKHTRYLDPEAYAELQQNSEGAYSGIGVEVEPDPAGGMRVVKVIPRGPAELAGVLLGDRVLTVDQVDILTMPFRDAVALVRGPRGEPVSLGIERQGSPERITLMVTRDEVHAAAVTGEWVEPGLAYVRLEQFRRHSGQEFAAVLSDLQSKGPLTGLVLDLRDNPGGLLDEAVKVVDAFVSEGIIVTTQGRSAGASESHSATASPEDLLTQTIVVLVDGTSASASEIVAGALQDLGRATVVGQPTYGKGSVQSDFEFQDKSALRLTIARYYLPSGRAIEVDGGIQPDVIQSRRSPIKSPVEQLEEQLDSMAGIDPAQRQELLNLVRNLDLKTPVERGPPRFSGTIAHRASNDMQLQRALQIARAATP